MSSDTFEKRYTVKDVSEMLGVNEETVRRWIRSGELKSEIESQRQGYTISMNDLASYIANIQPRYKKRLPQKTSGKAVIGAAAAAAGLSALIPGIGSVLVPGAAAAVWLFSQKKNQEAEDMQQVGSNFLNYLSVKRKFGADFYEAFKEGYESAQKMLDSFSALLERTEDQIRALSEENENGEGMANKNGILQLLNQQKEGTEKLIFSINQLVCDMKNNLDEINTLNNKMDGQIELVESGLSDYMEIMNEAKSGGEEQTGS